LLTAQLHSINYSRRGFRPARRFCGAPGRLRELAVPGCYVRNFSQLSSFPPF